MTPHLGVKPHPTPSGTRDFPPEDMRLRSWLFGEFAAVSRLFGFEQWDAPVMESEELFVRKAGEEITEQLYNFEVRYGGEVTEQLYNFEVGGGGEHWRELPLLGSLQLHGHGIIRNGNILAWPPVWDCETEIVPLIRDQWWGIPCPTQLMRRTLSVCVQDKGQRRVALRPELTPSLARLVLQRQKTLPLPAKWFAIGQCWRYERMTRGRR